MDARTVADLGQVLLGEHEDLALVRAAELRVHVQVLLVQSLQLGVENAADLGIRHLLHDFRSGLDSVVLRHQGGQAVHVERVVGLQLVLRSGDELQLVNGDAQRAHHGLDDALVVGGAELQQLPCGLHVVQVGVEVGEEDGHLGVRRLRKDELRIQQSKSRQSCSWAPGSQCGVYRSGWYPSRSTA